MCITADSSMDILKQEGNSDVFQAFRDITANHSNYTQQGYSL